MSDVGTEPSPLDQADVESSDRSRRPWLIGLAVLLAAIAVTGATMLLQPDEPLPGIQREPALAVDGLELVDYASSDQGEVTDLVPADGRLNLAYVGYLSCPDVCPTTMADLRQAFARMDPATTERLTVSFLTVDEERDTGPDVRDYLGLFFDDSPVDVAAMRADATTSIDEATDRLGAVYEVAEHDEGDERYDVAHSAITYVIDDTGTVVRELPFGASPDDFVAVIRDALQS